MSKSITNEQAERVLLAFYYGIDENTDSKYDEFREYHNGIMLMVLHKNLRWSSGISELGYTKVVNAYNALAELGFLDEITSEEIDRIVEMFDYSASVDL